MPQVKLKVLQSSGTEIVAKLHKELGKVKYSDKSKDRKQALLFKLFDAHMKKLTLGDVSKQKPEQRVEKINKILDKFEALAKNKKLKSQIIDAFKKRSKSKGEKKVTLKSQTLERLKALFKTQGIKGSYDSSINQLLTLFGAPELLGSDNATTREVSAAEVESEASQKLVLDKHTAETLSANDSKDAVNASAVDASKGSAKKKKKKKKKKKR